jgi:hypothetical protein
VRDLIGERNQTKRNTYHVHFQCRLGVSGNARLAQWWAIRYKKSQVLRYLTLHVCVDLRIVLTASLCLVEQYEEKDPSGSCQTVSVQSGYSQTLFFPRAVSGHMSDFGDADKRWTICRAGWQVNPRRSINSTY